MIAHIAPQPGHEMVEIGPGQGALTGPLLDRLGRLTAVELDRDLAAQLEQRFTDRLQLIVGDALELDLAAARPEDEQRGGQNRLRVVGNLPYNVSTPILFHLLSMAERIEDMHLLLQKEVVDRMLAPAGTKERGRLSVMIQYRCSVERCFNVPAGAFFPPPKVMSSFVRLIPHRVLPLAATDEQWLARVVTAAFGGRRKTLRNSLRGLVSAESMAQVGVDPVRRAESLSVEEFVRIAG